MRIGLVIESLDPRRGGVEQWSYQFARQVVAADHELHVFARQFAPCVRELKIGCHEVLAPRSREAFASAVEQSLQRFDLDVIHDTGCGWSCDIFQPHGGSRLASFEQNLLLAPRWLRPLKRQSARWSPRYREFRRLLARQYGQPERTYLAISRMVSRDLERFHQVPEQQIKLVYNGVDIERFSPQHRFSLRAQVRQQLNVSENEVLLLIVAHNFRLKGVPTLVEATRQLLHRGHPVRLVVVGGKKRRSESIQAPRTGAGSSITYVGPIDDPVPFYAAADIYVQPTFYDPCSLVVLEALASGLPVVTSHFNGAGELMTEGLEGSIVQDPADAEELAQRLLPLLVDRRRAQMSAAARRLAERHTLQQNCQEILALYQSTARPIARRPRAATKSALGGRSAA